ncbi:hypothetical protein Caci_3046 [Catenulispora acidiphila DSM 44928]|uniref:Uncharacterized protein n=1 Tax=Catenulispora acidiphila (strain DSM 44928 / JCM 14897 / NBRC 102108 / NRRL B-24433 / ID139908) TaxID=479433 RepID=C7Q4I6_CATAD|nr:hypothetical protein [Catenulispora acidiphila]ACU71955.1 hypothetical protein Caci_3046 [Catenulispora acidiphila DSM 44928]
MIAIILITLLVIGVLTLTGLLVMAHRDNEQLREDLSQTVPFRDSEFAKPFVPPQQPKWQAAEEHLRDPNDVGDET